MSFNRLSMLLSSLKEKEFRVWENTLKFGTYLNFLFNFSESLVTDELEYQWITKNMIFRLLNLGRVYCKEVHSLLST